MTGNIIWGVIIGTAVLLLCSTTLLAYLYSYQKKITQIKQRKLQELRTFLLSASHDFKAPLARISGLANLGKMNPTESQYELIKKMANEMNGLLDELVHIIRVDEGERSPVTIEFEKLIVAILDNFKVNPEYRKVLVKKNIKVDHPFVSDQWLVNTILYNLISNAFKYSKKNHSDSFIDIEIKDYKKGVVISVADNGIGIPQDHQETIFEFQKRATSQAYGLGLGLFIVKNAVQKLEGKLSINSIEGKGTTFKVDLPSVKESINP